VELINSRALTLAPIVTHSLPADEVQAAMDLALDRGKAVKVQVVF